MKHCMLLIVLTIVVTGLVAEGEFLWQEGGKPLVTSADIRWNGSAVDTPDGGKIIVWSETTSGNHDIVATRLDANGQLAWDVPRVLVDMESPAYDEQVALSSDGCILLSWYSYYDGLLCVNKFDMEGNQLWDESYSHECYCGYYNEYHNRPLIPDLNGGVYALWNTNGPSFAMHLDSAGNSEWDAPLELFEDYDDPHVYVYDVIADGEDGFIAGSNLNWDGQSVIALQHVLPDGSTDWYLEMPKGRDQQIIRTGEGQFALVTAEYIDSRYNICLYRFDSGGELLTDEPLLLDDIDSVIEINLEMDAQGNLYVGLNYRVCFVGILDTYKITPDNQISWTFSPELSTDAYPHVLRTGVDSSGNVYQSYFTENEIGINILKLQPNGELSWSNVLASDTNDYAIYADMVLDIDDDSATVIWNAISDQYDVIYRQTCTGDGSVVYEDEDTYLHQGWSNDFDSFAYAESSDPQDELFFTWLNDRDKTVNMQSLDTSGELGIEDPGAQIAFLTGEYTEIKSILEVDNQYYIAWQEYINDVLNLYVNLFDHEGNRQWQEDILVEGINSYSAVTTVFHDDHLLIYALGWGEHFNYDLKAQRIQDGQLVWDEPVTISDDVDSDYLVAIEDYVFFEECATRLDANGEPCEGWDMEGIDLEDVGTLLMDPMVTDEGIILIGKIRHNNDYWVRMQILHADGTTEYGVEPILVESDDVQFNKAFVTDEIVYLLGLHGTNLMAKAVDFEGNPVWDSDVMIASPVHKMLDTKLIPDGILMLYARYDNEADRTLYELQHIDFGGELWEDTQIITDKMAYYHHANITPATDNRYFITWIEDRDVSDTGYLYGQLLHYEPLANDEQTDIPAWKPNMSVYPNPFNPETNVRFSLCRDSKVDLKVYNVKGQLVRTLCDEVLPLGNHEITWDGTDNAKKSVSSGVYLFNLKINGNDYRSKALLLK